MVWTLTDNQNTVRDLAAYSGGTTTVVNHRVFSAYGQLLSQTIPGTNPLQPAAVDCLFAYTGRPMSVFSKNGTTGAVTGLDNNGKRWYDSITGRWLRQDPIGFAGGDANLYRYCGNSPRNATDPRGLASVMEAWPPPGTPSIVGFDVLLGSARCPDYSSFPKSLHLHRLTRRGLHQELRVFQIL